MQDSRRSHSIILFVHVLEFAASNQCDCTTNAVIISLTFLFCFWFMIGLELPNESLNFAGYRPNFFHTSFKNGCCVVLLWSGDRHVRAKLSFESDARINMGRHSYATILSRLTQARPILPTHAMNQKIGTNPKCNSKYKLGRVSNTVFTPRTHWKCSSKRCPLLSVASGDASKRCHCCLSPVVMLHHRCLDGPQSYKHFLRHLHRAAKTEHEVPSANQNVYTLNPNSQCTIDPSTDSVQEFWNANQTRSVWKHALDWLPWDTGVD